MKKCARMIVVAAALLMTATGVAMAGGHAGTVSDYTVVSAPFGDLAYFEIDNTRADMPTCAGSHTGFVVNPDKHLGQVIYDALKAGSTVEIWGSGDCQVVPNWENAVRATIAD